MILRDQPGLRVTRVLDRGQYDQGREEVSPGVPAVLSPMDPALPRDRLGLARWLTSAEHPLTAGVGNFGDTDQIVYLNTYVRDRANNLTLQSVQVNLDLSAPRVDLDPATLGYQARDVGFLECSNSFDIVG